MVPDSALSHIRASDGNEILNWRRESCEVSDNLAQRTVLCASLVAAACVCHASVSEPYEDARKGNLRVLQESLDSFAIDLYREAVQEDQNLFFA